MAIIGNIDASRNTMNNEIEPKPICELLKMNFFIPSYQRGYRWTKQQVNDLLNDIDNFELNEEKTSWYCLQPLVVKIGHKDNEIEYEVIDGQQRLTTIFLITHYFNEKLEEKERISEPRIRYETRENSTEALDNLKIDLTTNKVVDNNPLINIDHYHITEAYQTIHNWFTKKENNNKHKNLQSKLHNNTKIIWFLLTDDNDSIATFTRINMGKIPLTNAELIKALFLQKKNNDEITEYFQLEIASEWDKIEYTLQNDNFWWFLNKKENNKSSRIELIFDMMCKITEKDIGTDQYATFRLFNEKYTNEPVKNIWNEIKDYFLAFEEWFNNPIWYHYIGYLVYFDVSIDDIYKLYKNSPKNVFADKLNEKIKFILKSINCVRYENSNPYYTFDLSFESNNDKEKIKKTLLLFNIQYIVDQYKSLGTENNTEVLIRFPFKIFKNEKWDIEHIHPNTENKLTNKSSQNEWLQITINDIKISGELKSRIDDYLIQKESTVKFDELRDDIIKLTSNDELDSGKRNGIGNLTLLDAGTNRSYGNDLFPTKRRKIIENDMNGKFIPICTKNVFLKYFDKHGLTHSQWSESDMDTYQNAIGHTLKNFLNFNVA